MYNGIVMRLVRQGVATLSAPRANNIRRAAQKVQSISTIGEITGIHFLGIQIFYALKPRQLNLHLFRGKEQLKRFSYALDARRERIAGFQFVRRQRLSRQGLVENHAATFRETRNEIKSLSKS
jgi:hypothetical protein